MEKLINNPILIWFRNNSKLIQFQLLINFAFLVFISLASYINIPLSGFKDHFIYFIHLLILQTTVSGFLYLLCLNKWVFRIVFNSLFFLLSLVSFWVYAQDISITDTLIAVVLETKLSIVKDVLNIPYLLYILLIIAVLVFINKQFNKLEKRFNIYVLIFSFLAIILFQVIEKKRVNTLKARLPYNVFYGVKDYFKKSDYSLKTISNEVSAVNQNLKIILVLGESVRADHLGVNGYSRQTTPWLAKQENCISFKNIYTPHTYTNTSLPRILSNKSITDDNLENLTSIYSIFNECNYETTWIGNQELERSYKPITNSNKNLILIDSLRSVFSFKKAYDIALLKPFQKLINSPKPQLITMHMMGSHWYYDNRYTANFRKYLPVTNSKYIPSQSPEQIINAYDNTILYLDNFLNQTINSLQNSKEPSILIYLSDHGERLGENGKWLHAETAAEATNTACVFWYSKAFKDAFPDKIKALEANKNNAYSTDFLYATLLDIIQVNNLEYYRTNSIFYSTPN